MRTFKFSQFQLHARIVRSIRHGRNISRGALADEMGTSPSTMGMHVDDLIQQGFLEESGLEQGGIGRPKRLLRLIPEAGWFAGIEFTGGRLQAERLNFGGEREKSHIVMLPKHIRAPALLKTILDAITALQAGAKGPLLAVGVGSPGFIDAQAGHVVYSEFLDDWNNIPLVAEIRSHFPVAVAVENNLHVIALGERWFGDGRDADDYVIVRARNGFGLGIIKEGRLLGGAHHGVGEIGLWPWPLDGGTDFVHNALSARHVWQKLSGSQAEPPDNLTDAMVEFADKSGPEWDDVVDTYARVLGLTQLLIDTKLYFLHGPLVALGTRFCEDVKARSLQIIPQLLHSPIQLVPSRLGPEAGALGAAGLAMEAWDPSEKSAAA
ncbi:MAG: ROK family protein [Verrucomicrobiaceae bacterium]|nr:ROK family protein [Verrucomicrobiaceae bacterium]